MNIGIVGFGFVGKALNASLLDNVNVVKVDPKLNKTINDLKNFNPDIIFICLPTPMHDDGSQDVSIVKSVLAEIKKIDLKSLIVIKSTILPNYIKEIEILIPSFVYNPEFLREKHAKEDFINSNLIVFGGSEVSSKILEKFYREHTKCICKDYVYTDPIAASFIKYSINTFLATKVIFFNELYFLFNSSGTNESWKNLIYAISKDNRIGGSHMDVPGHDGRFGFGGACLPKDSNALISFAELQNQSLNTLKNVVKTNNKIRNRYNKSLREKEQNINFSTTK